MVALRKGKDQARAFIEDSSSDLTYDQRKTGKSHLKKFESKIEPWAHVPSIEFELALLSQDDEKNSNFFSDLKCLMNYLFYARESGLAREKIPQKQEAYFADYWDLGKVNWDGVYAKACQIRDDDFCVAINKATKKDIVRFCSSYPAKRKKFMQKLSDFDAEMTWRSQEQGQQAEAVELLGSKRRKSDENPPSKRQKIH